MYVLFYMLMWSVTCSLSRRNVRLECGEMPLLVKISHHFDVDGI